MLTDTNTRGIPQPDAQLDPAIHPSAPLIVGGFLIACAVTGAVAGVIARATRSHDHCTMCAQGWLSRLAWLSAAATLELIVVGGLVTSSESGLAVPDWPGTYGANMFLYPISLMTNHRIYLEHAHRLFGSMVGLVTIAVALSVLVGAKDRRSRLFAIPGVVLALALGGLIALRGSGQTPTWLVLLAGVGALAAIAWTIACFVMGSRAGVAFALVALVTAQGTLGGLRVTEQSAWMGVFHGILAQLFLALLVAQAVWLAPAWRGLEARNERELRRLRAFTTGATHAIILQLVVGAMFRHTENGSHALWSHVGFSAVVVFLVILAGIACLSLGAVDTPPSLSRRMRRYGHGMLGVVFLQFGLGVGALVLVMQAGDRGPVPTAERLKDAEIVPLSEVLFASAHQANGAVLLCLLTGAQVWAKRAYRKGGEESRKTM